jgi:hypothetical protein
VRKHFAILREFDLFYKIDTRYRSNMNDASYREGCVYTLRCRLDLCPCKVSRSHQPTTAQAQDGGAPHNDTHVSAVRRFVRDHYAPFLLKPVVKIVVLLLFAATAVSAVLRLSSLKEGQSWEEYLPRDSYLIDFIQEQEKAFSATGSEHSVVEFVFDLRAVDFSSRSDTFSNCSLWHPLYFMPSTRTSTRPYTD